MSIQLQKLLNEIEELSSQLLAKKRELEQFKAERVSAYANLALDLTLDILKSRIPSMPEPPKTVPWPVHSPATKPRSTYYKYSCGQQAECRFGLEGKDKVCITHCYHRFHCPYLKITECNAVKLGKTEN